MNSRRDFLKALGFGAASIPFFKVMERGSAHGAPGDGPLRLIVFWNAHGTVWPHFRPKGSGNEFDLTPSSLDFQYSVLKPLSNYTDQLLVVEGLSYEAAIEKDGTNAGVGHNQAAGTFLTGRGIDDDGTYAWTDGPSLDHVLGQEVGGAAAVRSLMLGINHESGNGFYQSFSFDDSGIAKPGLYRPGEVWDLLFEGVQPTVDPAAIEAAKLRGAQRTSVVERLNGAAKRMQGRLGSQEKLKLDRHLDALSELQREIALRASSVGCNPPDRPVPPPPEVEHWWGSSTWIGTPDFPGLTDVMFRLIGEAIACDRSRIFIAHSLRAGLGGEIPWLPPDPNFPGVDPASISDIHATAHVARTDAAAGHMVALYQNWHAKQLAHLMDILSAIPEGSGSVLDNTLILWGNEFDDPQGHAGANVPIVLAGGAAGKFKMGRYLKVPDRTPHNQLLAAILQAFDVNVSGVGPSKFSGVLSGLT